VGWVASGWLRGAQAHSSVAFAHAGHHAGAHALFDVDADVAVGGLLQEGRHIVGQ